MHETTDNLNRLDFKHTGLVERVSATLSKAILEGVFKEGDQLVEVKLQHQFGISRSPLREAFRDLEKKGLVIIIPRKGTFVRQVTRKDIEDNFPVRAKLEGLAAREAFRKMTAGDLTRLEEAFQRMQEAAAEKDGQAYMENHRAFHEAFIRASGNEVLIGILENLRLHSLWYQFCYKYYKEDFQKSLRIHQKILDLFHDKNSNEQAIEKTVSNHITIALDRFISYLEETK